MGRDEQKEEREVLDSIFPDEINDVSEIEYRISIALELSDGGIQDEEAPVIILGVRYPEDYPDVAPDLDISAPPNAPKHKNFDIQEDKARLLTDLRPTVDENMGMAMVFTLVSTLKENAEMLIGERQKEVDTQREAEAAKAEEEENKKFHGTVVTTETFLKWRNDFFAEMAESARREQEEKEAEDRRKRIVKEGRKMTGRELWEKGLAGKADEEEFEDLDSDSGIG